MIGAFLFRGQCAQRSAEVERPIPLLQQRRFMERRFLPLWVLVAPRNSNPQASLRISLLDEERLL